MGRVNPRVVNGAPVHASEGLRMAVTLAEFIWRSMPQAVHHRTRMETRSPGSDSVLAQCQMELLSLRALQVTPALAHRRSAAHGCRMHMEWHAWSRDLPVVARQ